MNATTLFPSLSVLLLASFCVVGCGGEANGEDEENATGGTSSSTGGGPGTGGTGGGSGGQSTGGAQTSGGSSGAGGSATGQDGQVTDAFSAYCIATFTEDYTSIDPFGDPVFTARAGERYLMASYGNSVGSRAELLFLTPTGPAEFDVQGDQTTGTLPFDTNCAPDAWTQYYAVFADVTVFAEASLTTELCRLTAGTVLPLASGNSGFALESFGSDTQSSVYSIILNAFSAQCGGAEVGYIATPEVEVFGSTTVLVPIVDIIGPG